MSDIDFERLVEENYQQLYRFAFSLAKSETTACDLTQQAFYLWAAKGHGLRDRTKVKSWLFTTLYREFLNARRHEVRFPHVELDGDEPTTETPATFSALDGATVLDALREIDEVFRAPLTLFYLEDFSYREIADVLEIPCGTVMSRLSRGKAQLRRALADRARETEQKIVQMPTLPQKAK